MVVIGIAGGSASGKTTLAQRIFDAFNQHVGLLKHDYYYKAHDDIPLEERKKLNYDHPDAYDTGLLVQDLERLKRGESIQHPLYDYVQHTRKKETQLLRPSRVLIVEGILIFENAKLRDLFDIKVFVDTDDDLRFIRRLSRDVKERGRNPDEVIEQYLHTTKVMHDQFVATTRRQSDIIIPNNDGRFNHVAVEMLIHRIRAILNEDQPDLF